MTNQEFMSECNKYIEDTYREFENYQLIVLDILKQVVDICDKYRINYYLAFGTLLGFVRDGQNIPWDYDIDIMIMHSDIVKFKNALREGLKDEYYYAYTDTVEGYPTNCLRVCKNGYPFTSLHVDVYFLVGLPDDENERQTYILNVNKLCQKRKEKYRERWFGNERQRVNIYTKIALIYRKIRSSLYTSKRLVKCESLLYGRFDGINTQYVFSVGDPYKKIYERKWFENLEHICYEGYSLSVPANYHEILSMLYGDYTKYLPIENRFDEFYKMVRIVRMRNMTIQAQ